MRKNKLTLCVDIDGTVTGAYDWLQKTNAYFGRDFKEQDVQVYDIHQLYGVPRSAYDDFYALHGVDLHKENSLRPHVKDSLEAFYRLGLHIHFVTARSPKMTQVTSRWLNQHQLPYESLHLLGSHDKVQKAQDLNCDVFIEDRYENALQLAQSGFSVILIDCNYNQGPLPSNVIRLQNWRQVKMYVQAYHYLMIDLEFKENRTVAAAYSF